MEGNFKTNYGKVAQNWDEKMRPVIRREMKMRMRAAYDQAGKKILETQKNLSCYQNTFDNYNINKVVESKEIIEQCEDIQRLIKEDYLFQFGKEMKIVDNDDDEE